MFKTANLVTIVAIAIAFLAGIKLAPHFVDTKIDTQNMAKQPQQQTFTCPMHSHIQEPHQGECPICSMDLVEKKIEKPANKNQRAEVLIEPAIANNFGVKTTPVIRDTISKNVTIYGYINKISANKAEKLQLTLGGKIHQLNQKQQYYQQNDTIFILESNTYFQAQQDYITAQTNKDIRKIRQLDKQLKQMGLNRAQLKQLIENKQAKRFYHFKAPKEGKFDISHLSVGQTISANTIIGTLTPRYPISAYAKVFETQWIWLKAGQKIELKIRNYPGQTWHGIVKSVEDLAQSSTTAVKLYADFEANPNINLRLGMQGQMTVATATKKQALLVPNSAVIRTANKIVVVIDKGDGYYQPIDVKTGLSNDVHTEIIEGLSADMQVVISGQFLIDSESEINSAINKLTASKESL